jgi:hypothetical protein
MDKRVETSVHDAGKPSRELRPGRPFLGAKGPEGAKFLGWVLIQLWEPVADVRGTPSHLNWSGDESVLFRAAAEELTRRLK